MKKKLIFTFCIMLFILISIYFIISFSKREWKDVELPSDEILLISQYINFAWGYQNNGIFIDSEGSVYSFDFSQASYNLNQIETDADFINELHTIRASKEPIATLNASLLKELYWYVSQININSTFNKNHRACDAGSDSIKIYDTGSQTLITCYQTGDYDGELQDAYAKKLCSLFKRKIQPIISFNTFKNDSKQSLKSESKDSTELSIIQTETLPTYHFTSPEEVEQMPDEDLIFINQHNYKTVDFYTDGEFKELDLFGIEPDKEIYENVSIDFFWLKDLEIELDVSNPLPEDEFQRLVDNDIEMMYYYANTQKPGDETGRIVVSKDTFFCGENDLYAEYSVRYTQRCTMYENNKLTSTDVPRAYRQVYLKNYVVETNVNDWRAYLLGELSADYVKEQLDVFHSYDNTNPIIYREVIEQDNRYIYSTYYTSFEYSDWGKNNVVILWNYNTYVYKDTHLVTSTDPFEIRRAEIPGTENDVHPIAEEPVYE